MSRTHLFEWHRRFREGREEVEDDLKSGRPFTSRTDENVECVRQKVLSDRRLTVRMIAYELAMNSERVWRIIMEDLGMRKICAKMVPRLLNEGQQEWHVQVSRHFGATRNWTQLVEKSYWRWVTDLQVRSTFQMAEPWMEERIVTKTQKGEGVQVQNQGDADRFFWCPWNCPCRILATRLNCLSACLQNILRFLMCSVREKKKDCGNEIMAASSWQCSSS